MSFLDTMFAEMIRVVSMDKEIPYEDASNLYTVVHYYALPGDISRETALRLLAESGPRQWTTEILSWFVSLLKNPYVTPREIEDFRKEHVLYQYPCLVPLFRLYNILGMIEGCPPSKKFQQDFPGIFVDHVPTVAERVLMELIRESVYTSSLELSDVEELNRYSFSHLIPISLNSFLTSDDIKTIHKSLVAVKQSRISAEKFRYYLKSWEINILARVYGEFLCRDWSKVDIFVIGWILEFSSGYQGISRLIAKHGKYARIASSNKLMCYFLGIPLEFELQDKVLFEKLDKALENIGDHIVNISRQNIKIANRLIKDCDSPIVNCVTSGMYAYPTSELVFYVKNNELRCYTRLNFNTLTSSTDPITYSKLLSIDSTSPLNMRTCRSIGFNYFDLVEYFSSPNYHSSQILDKEQRWEVFISETKRRNEESKKKKTVVGTFESGYGETDSNLDLVYVTMESEYDDIPVDQCLYVSSCPLSIEDLD